MAQVSATSGDTTTLVTLSAANERSTMFLIMDQRAVDDDGYDHAVCLIMEHTPKNARRSARIYGGIVWECDEKPGNVLDNPRIRWDLTPMRATR